MPMSVRYCHNCDSEIDRDYEEYYFCDDCNTFRCETCGPCEERNYRLGGIHDYNWRPRHFKPKGNYPAETLLGVELEVGGRRPPYIVEAVHLIDSVEDHLYLKEDGSFDLGLEIVTHPMTLAYARGYEFPKLLRELRRLRCRVDDGYGLHVHVSRNAFRCKGKQSRTHQMVWLMFLYRNATQLEGLARRSSERWASFAKPGSGELARKANAIRAYDDNRYVAVNCNNERTFELRFFKSTLKDQEFFAALEFADASVAYTRTLTAATVLRGKGLTWAHFTAWVDRHDYPNLSAEIAALTTVQKPLF